jgi:thermolabile hemolysin
MIEKISQHCLLVVYLVMTTFLSTGCAFFSFSSNSSQKPYYEQLNLIKLTLNSDEQPLTQKEAKHYISNVYISSNDPKIILGNYMQTTASSSVLLDSNYSFKDKIERYSTVNPQNQLLPFTIYFAVNNTQRSCQILLKTLKDKRGKTQVVPVSFLNDFNDNGVNLGQQVPCFNDPDYSLVASNSSNVIILQHTKFSPYKLRCEFFNDALSLQANSLNFYIAEKTVDGLESLNVMHSVPILGNNTYGSRMYTKTSIDDITQICEDTLRYHDNSRNTKLVRVRAISKNSDESLDNIPLDIFSFSKNSYKKIDNIVVLGDSISDNGNLYNMSFDFVPNRNSWYEGRFTNGPVWADYLSQNMKVNNVDLAIGGVKTTNQMLIEKMDIIQLMLFSPYSQINYIPFYIRQDLRKTLFFVTIGGNDIFSVDELPPAKAYQKLDKTIDNYELTVRKMIDFGAENIILIEVPELGKLPHYHNKGGAVISMTNYSNYYNGKMQLMRDKIYKEFKEKGVKIFVYHLVEYLQKNFKAQNIPISCLNVTEFNDEEKTDVDYTSKQGDFIKGCPDTIYWDDIHPTTYVHKKVAADIYRFILTHWYLI